MIRLSEFLLAFGLSFENIVLPIVFIVTPFLTYTIPISFLFGLMLAFSRLSSDGEYVGLLASGYGLRKILFPVLCLTAVVLSFSVYCGTYLESWGRKEYLAFTYKKTQTELDNLIRSKMQSKVFLEDFLGYTFYADEVGPNKEKYKNVFISPQSSSQSSKVGAITAPRATIKGSVEEESLTMSLYDGTSYSYDSDEKQTSVSNFSKLDVDILRLFRQQIFGSETRGEDYRSLSTTELYSYLEAMKDSGEINSKKYYKPSYLFHVRISSGFFALVFAMFGLALGIADPRRGKGRAYTYAIATVIGSYIFTSSFKGMAESGQVNTAIAAWLPLGIQFLLGVFFLYQKNRLPPSESVLAPRNLPLLGKLVRK